MICECDNGASGFYHHCENWYGCSVGSPWYRYMMSAGFSAVALQWRHNEQDSVSNHQSHNCLPNCLFRPGSNKTSKLRVTGLCAGNSPGTGEFPAQMASNAENVSIWWRHDGIWYITVTSLERVNSSTTRLFVKRLVYIDIKMLTIKKL